MAALYKPLSHKSRSVLQSITHQACCTFHQECRNGLFRCCCRIFTYKKVDIRRLLLSTAATISWYKDNFAMLRERRTSAGVAIWKLWVGDLARDFSHFFASLFISWTRGRWQRSHSENFKINVWRALELLLEERCGLHSALMTSLASFWGKFSSQKDAPTPIHQFAEWTAGRV